MTPKELVAVYGTLKHGHCNHPILKDCKLIGVVRIQGFDLYDLGAYPTAISTCDPEATIHCEIYEILNGDVAYRLDTLEGYPRHYDRKKVNTEHGDVWVYYQHYSYDKSQLIKNGEW